MRRATSAGMWSLHRRQRAHSWFRFPIFALPSFFESPPLANHRPTLRRKLNLALARYEHLRGRTKLRSYPTRLVVEPASACNLRCPYCTTGAGGVGRPPGLMTMDLYRRLLDELGDYLLDVEAFHWGEPLLNPHLDAMIREASERGIGTTVNTNLSLHLDDGAAERLVASGLSELTVSIDGARQETYEQYRVRGRLQRVLDNCRLIGAAKRRTGREFPRFNFEFHVFPHNVGDVDRVGALARELEMNLRVFKGVVPGAEWGKDSEFRFCVNPLPTPTRCVFLWTTALVSTDGGCLPCRGAFYAEDDFGKLAVRPDELGSATFRQIWNGPRYQAARSLFNGRAPATETRALLCSGCPNVTMWRRWKEHEGAGRGAETFDVGFGTNEIWNYFWDRRPASAIRLHAANQAPKRDTPSNPREQHVPPNHRRLLNSLGFAERDVKLTPDS